MKQLLFILSLISGICLTANSQNGASVYVDEEGVMRWASSDEALANFGVNYTTPYAHAFRAHKRLGIPLEQAIDP